MPVKLPILPKELITLLEATAKSLPGKVRVVPSRASVTVPAGYTYRITVNIPAGWVSVAVESLKILSDYYSSDLLMDVWVDGYKVNPFPLPISAPIDVNFGAYYVQRRQINIDLYNFTNQDATLTIDCISCLLDPKLFENFFEPLIMLSYKALEKLARGEGVEVLL